ncbi:MAG: hypothetical protein NUV82_00730, partial [Candidatus Komeilibacteria bacterium]|nr:hypothetical protein [Candidatus Komeilibacteria bacterium]
RLFAPDTIRISRYDESKRQWLVLPTVIAAEGTATALFERLGYYRLVGSVSGWEAKLSDGVYRLPNSSKLYLVEDDIRHYVSTAVILESWRYKLSEARVNFDLNRVPLGTDLKYRDGTLVKAGAATYYFITEGRRRLFMNRSIMSAMGYTDEQALPIELDELVSYPEGRSIVEPTSKPNGALFKYSDSAKVYRLENGRKRWIVDESAFNKNRYRWEMIITAPLLEIYPDGEPII